MRWHLSRRAEYLFIGTGLLYFLYPVFAKLLIFYNGESLYSDAVKEHTLNSFLNGTLPLWNPLLGPGGYHAIAFSYVGWDYRLLLWYFLGHEYTFVFDVVLIFLAYTFCVCKIKLLDGRSLLIVFLAFLAFYNLDYVNYFTPSFNYNSVFIAYPLLVFYIFAYESKGEASDAFWAGCIYLFAFHGTKIEILFQFHVFVFLSLIAIRYVFNRKTVWLRNEKNKTYALILSFGLIANYWQLDWLYSMINESGRLKSNPFTVWEVFQQFYLSFKYSNIIGSYFIYYVIAVSVLSLKGNLPRNYLYPIPFLIGFLLLPPSYNPSLWFEDINVLIQRPLIFILILLPFLIHFFRRPGLIGVLFEIPFLFLMILHFLFENQKTYNWGETVLEKSSVYVIAFFALSSSLSIFSKYKKWLNVSIIILILLYLLRAHIQVLTMGLWGVVWHIERDAIYYSFWISILIVLGLVHIYERVQRPYNWLGTAALSICLLVFFTETSYKNNSFTSRERFNVSLANNALNYFSEEFTYEPSSETLLISNKVLMAGSLLRHGVHQANIYESTIPLKTKLYFEKYNSLSDKKILDDLPKNCRLQFIWFPNNIHRVFKCPRKLRSKYYISHIAPNIIFDNLELIRDLSVSGIITNEKIKLPKRFIPIPTNIKVADDPVVYWKDKNSSKSLIQFKNKSCKDSNQDWKNLSNTNNVYEKPFLKRKFKFGFEIPEEGCIRIRMANTNRWKIYLNGKESLFELPDSMFIHILAKKGTNKVTLIYDPYFLFKLVSGVLAMLTWIVFGKRFLLRAYKG